MMKYLEKEDKTSLESLAVKCKRTAQKWLWRYGDYKLDTLSCNSSYSNGSKTVHINMAQNGKKVYHHEIGHHIYQQMEIVQFLDISEVAQMVPTPERLIEAYQKWSEELDIRKEDIAPISDFLGIVGKFCPLKYGFRGHNVIEVNPTVDKASNEMWAEIYALIVTCDIYSMWFLKEQFPKLWESVLKIFNLMERR